MKRQYDLTRFNRMKRLIDARRRSKDEGLQEEATLALQIVDRSVLDEERALRDSRYIDYRYLTPWQATERFADEYDRLARNYLKGLGINLARQSSPALAFLPDRTISGMWRARQVADALGMPYGTFIKSGMEYMLQESGAKRLPRPNQLWGSEQLQRAMELWADHNERFAVKMLGVDADDRFFVENFRDEDPVRIAVADAVEQRVRDAGKSGMQRALYLRNFLHRNITEAEARARFGDSLVDDAIEELARSGGHKPRPERTEPLPPWRPDCYGFAYVRDNAICIACPVYRECGELTGKAKANLVTRTGTDDPRAAKLRESNRLRQQAYRRRKRAELAGPDVGGESE